MPSVPLYPRQRSRQFRLLLAALLAILLHGLLVLQWLPLHVFPSLPEEQPIQLQLTAPQADTHAASSAHAAHRNRKAVPPGLPFEHTPAVEAASPTHTEPPATSSPPAASTPAPLTPAQPDPASPPATPPRFNIGSPSNPSPAYPAYSIRQRETGRVLLRVQVSATGTPTAIDLEQSSGFFRLDRAAIQAVWTWRFTPAQEDGHPEAGDVLVPIHFRLAAPGH